MRRRSLPVALVVSVLRDQEVEGRTAALEPEARPRPPLPLTLVTPTAPVAPVLTSAPLLDLYTHTHKVSISPLTSMGTRLTH